MIRKTFARWAWYGWAALDTVLGWLGFEDPSEYDPYE